MMLEPNFQSYLLLLDFYFRNEDRIKKMAEEQAPDNLAQNFIRYIKHHAATRTFNTLYSTNFAKTLLQKQMKEEDKNNVQMD